MFMLHGVTMPLLSDPPLQDITKESKNATGRKTDLSFSTLSGNRDCLANIERQSSQATTTDYHGNAMGFLNRLLNMPSFKGATNALLVELAIPELTEAQRTQLKGRVVELFKTHRSLDGTPEAVLVELNQTPRIFQLNVLALAMKDLGHPLPLKKEKFQKVEDPFDPRHADEHALRAVARRLKWHYGVEVWIAEESISFDSW